MSTSLSLPTPWPRHVVEKLFYVKGRIGWRGLRHDEFTDEGPYLVTGIHIQNGRVDWPSCYHVSKGKYAESPEIMVLPGDIVITKDGTIGKVAVIEEVLGPTTVNSHLFLVRPLDPTNGINSKFAYHVFSSFLFTEFVNKWMAGSTLSGLGEAKFLRFQFPVPPIQEQLKISAILDTLDDAIANTEATVKKLRQMRAGLLHDLLTRGLDKKGEFRDPVSHPEQFQGTATGLIPLEWEVKALSALCRHIGSGVTPRGGESVYTDAGVMFIRSQNVTFDGLAVNDVAFISERIHQAMLRSEVLPHDVLFNITGASIGRCCVMPAGLGRANVNQHVCILRLPDATATAATFLSSVLASPIGQKQLEALNTFGNRQGINYRQLGSFTIPWPGENERTRIAEQIWATDLSLNEEKRYLTKLRELESGLMSDLLTGRVRVPEKIV